MNTRIGLALLSLLAPASAQAADVIAMGDSWAFDGAPQLQTSLQGAGFSTFTVDNRGVPGLTAETMATQTATIAGYIAANPDAGWVWLSIGGNDLLARNLTQTPAQIAAANDQNIRAILSAIFAANPNLRVVMFGYDYLNYVQSAPCMAQLAMDYGPMATQLDVANLLVSTVGATMQTVADDVPNANYVPLYGTMQIAAGVVGAPDPSQPTPASHMRDCYHPNVVGFTALHDALVTAYWSQPMPTATANASATTICDGDVVTFTSMSTANEGQIWRLDGTQTSTQPMWTASLLGVGTATVTLEAYNRAYTDTATVPITIDSCVDAGMPMDAGAIDSGAMADAGMMDAGAVVDAGPDAGPDAGVDAGPDAGVDAGQDAGQDAGVDAGQDAGVDAGQDAGVDAGADAGQDAGPPDLGVDAGFPDAGFPDAEVDAGFPDAEVDAGFPDAEVDAGFPDAEVDAGFPDAEVDAGFPDAEVDGGFPDAEVDAGQPDTGVVPADAGSSDSGVGPPDGSVTLFDEIGISGDGCACDSHGVPDEAPSPWMGLGLLGLLALRRRRA